MRKNDIKKHHSTNRYPAKRQPTTGKAAKREDSTVRKSTQLHNTKDSRSIKVLY